MTLFHPSNVTKVSEVTLRYSSKVKFSERPKISCSFDSYNALFPWFEETIEHHESFYVMLLNRAIRVIGIHKVSQGGQSGTVADPKIIFQAALLSHSAGIIIAHNHPSGNLKPSQEDITLTNKIKEGAKLLEIQLLDHVIVTPEHGKYYSFADEGLL